MHHIMFDVDGTLVKSYDFDEELFTAAVSEVLDHQIDTNWNSYKHVSDAGILVEHLERQGITENHEAIHQAVRKCFTKRIKDYLIENPAIEIPGASSLIKKLKTIDSVSISIATGGWRETAILKLESAGIDVSGIPIASSNDHYSRTEIMKTARRKAGINSCNATTYFGDAAWDRKATEELGFNFILVGGRIEHEPSINDFQDIDQVLSKINGIEGARSN